MKILTFVTMIACIVLASCKKDKAVTGKINFSGITATDEFGNYIGEVDSSDWTNDGDFPDDIQNRLNFSDTFNYANTETGVASVDAFPNPVHSQFQLLFSSAKPSILKYIIVDESLTEYGRAIMRLDSKFSAVSVSANSFPDNKYFRVYYAFYNSSKTAFYKGHGDLIKK